MAVSRATTGMPFLFVSVVLSGTHASAAGKTPIYVWFSHHIDGGRVDVTSTEPIHGSHKVAAANLLRSIFLSVYQLNSYRFWARCPFGSQISLDRRGKRFQAKGQHG